MVLKLSLLCHFVVPPSTSIELYLLNRYCCILSGYHPLTYPPEYSSSPCRNLPSRHTTPMSSLTYTNEEGAGQKHSDLCHYSQAVTIGNIVKCSGQGGWNETGALDANDIPGQVDLAFQNVDKVLQAVGLLGWENVYSIRSYHVDIDASFNLVVKKLQERIPNHRPIWTSIAVPRLAFEAMKIEIEVEAIKQT